MGNVQDMGRVYRSDGAETSPNRQNLNRTTRARGFASWSPQRKTLALLVQVQSVLKEYEQYLPLTGRQIFYRLVGAHGYDKTERAYARLLEALNRARRAGLVPFNAIRDDGWTRREPDAWASPEQFIAAVTAWAQDFKRDRQSGQPVRLYLLCEAAGMVPLLVKEAEPFGVPVFTSGGFDSVTAKHALAQELAQCGQCEILHIGDHDPSGWHLFASLAEDVSEFVAALGGTPPTFTRLAVTPEQVAELNLPTAPPKATDRRAFEGQTVQAESIPPDVLAEIVRNAIVSRQDVKARESVLQRELKERQELMSFLEVQQ